ncbi:MULTISPECIES: DUF4190 domain-containing protein [Bacillus]|uniref:DUF4190 domain-containing protein n=1 Tax=Bacillus TaxID=1386 RepID=UPI000BB695D0|nr:MULTISPECIES: DUF4190 domain-containing protein [Bacillus]
MNETILTSKREETNIHAILSLIFGIMSLLGMMFTLIFGIVFALPGFILGIIGIKKTSTTNQPGRSLALAGLICSFLGLVLPLIIFIITILFFTPSDFIIE